MERGKVEEIQTKFLILLQKYLNRKSVKDSTHFMKLNLHMQAQDLSKHRCVQAGGKHHLPGQVQGAAPHVLNNTAWPGHKDGIGLVSWIHHFILEFIFI